MGRAATATHARPARDEVRAALARAEVLLARGDAGGAAALATRAAGVADAIPAPLDAAEARLLAGRALAAAGRPEEAKRALQRVAADAGRGRAGRLHRQAARELRRLGTRVSGAGRRVTRQPLSPRERGIADLVAGGSANKQVAAALFLSPKTVENALTRIYAKVGIRERRELPRALAAPSS